LFLYLRPYRKQPAPFKKDRLFVANNDVRNRYFSRITWISAKSISENTQIQFPAELSQNLYTCHTVSVLVQCWSIDTNSHTLWNHTQDSAADTAFIPDF
jgi:hypothetical protein